MARYFGYNPPFTGGQQNVFSRQEDERLIKNDLLQLLLTLPGERLNRPDFGTTLRSYVFEQNTQKDLALLRVEILEAISAYEPRVAIDTFRLESSTDGRTINLFIIARLIGDPNVRLTIDRSFTSPTN